MVRFKHRLLKLFRVGAALVFFLLISFFFLDFTGLFPAKLIKGSLGIQFIPSALLFSRQMALSAAGFSLVILITLLFGRLYCSSICPLGILQDFILRISQKGGEKRFRYHPSVKGLRHFVLLITLLTLFTGNVLVLGLLDPYSIFGRIFSGLLRPVVLAANNLVASLLQSIDIYSFSHLSFYPLGLSIYLISILFLTLIVLLTISHGRLYCNTICPVGTLLGYFSRLSIFKMRINPHDCRKCGACEEACKAECLDLENLTIDHSRCILCFNCVTSCQFKAIDYSPGKKLSRKVEGVNPESSSRRKALSSMLGGILLVRAGTDDVDRENKSESGFRIRRKHYVTPPGSGEIKEFASKCTGCHLCVNACPTGVIQPAQNELGWQNFMRVRLDFNAGYCNYECTRCMEICPTGALLPVPIADKKRTQIGKAKFVKENCIIIAEGTDCGACAEHCPTGAVRMVPHKNGIRIPEVDGDICIGCGACEHTCPSRPYKAIYVEGNKVHVIAEEPRKGEKAQETEFEGDFPF